MASPREEKCVLAVNELMWTVRVQKDNAGPFVVEVIEAHILSLKGKGNVVLSYSSEEMDTSFMEAVQVGIPNIANLPTDGGLILYTAIMRCVRVFLEDKLEDDIWTRRRWNEGD